MDHNWCLGQCEKSYNFLCIKQKICILYINSNICLTLEFHGEIRKYVYKGSLGGK